MGDRPALIASTFHAEVGRGALDHDHLGRLVAPFADASVREERGHRHADDAWPDDCDLANGPRHDLILI
jgi:hypothetical protein